MKLVNHDSKGATIHLDQRELLMTMALIQEGRDSFECDGQTGCALDKMISSALVLVEEARRQEIKHKDLMFKIGQVAEAGGPEDLKSA